MTDPPRQESFKIRDSRSEDAETIEILIQPFVEKKYLLERTLEEIRQLTRLGFVAENSAGKLIGFAAVEIYSRKLAEIQCLAVASEYQSLGIGRRLVELCIDCARQHHVLELMAISSSDAFLQSCGFDYSLPHQKRALFVRP